MTTTLRRLDGRRRAKTLSTADDVRPGPREVPPGQGYRVLRGVVPPEAVNRALRRIHLDLVRNGLTAEALGEWLWSAHWFPHLKWDPEIVALVGHLPDELRDGRLCDRRSSSTRPTTAMTSR